MNYNLGKIIRTLSLAASDTREETLKSIVLNSLYENSIPVDKTDLQESIDVMYDLSPYEAELQDILRKLEDANQITCMNGKYSLLESEKVKHRELELKAKENTTKRFENFTSFVRKDVNPSIDDDSLKELWEAFNLYLYNCFYDYGEKAIAIFIGVEKQKELLNGKDWLKEAVNILSSSQAREDFKNIVNKFPEHISSDDLNFIHSLGQKTLSFASLGVEPELAEELESKSIVDWIIYLDTNFLYSIMDLHLHPENESCRALVDLINTNNIKIKLYYSDITAKELKHKQKDFDTIQKNITVSAIKGLLKSNQLDEFTQRYYTGLLEDPSSTLHPSEIIDLSATILSKEGIKIAQNKARIEALGESYLNIKLQDYLNYIQLKNESRSEYAKAKGIEMPQRFRSEKQALHDITLREILLRQRANLDDGGTLTLNKVKFFALTLDDLLISYDQYEIRKNNASKSYPVFFKPSYLLHRLIKILPIKVDDHKKAFIKAVTARGFNTDISKTKDILAIVNFLKKKGIDNEEVIYNLVSEEVFLQTYKTESNKGSFDQEAFIESELNKIFHEKETEVKKYLLEIEQLQQISQQETEKNLQLKKERLEAEKEISKILKEKETVQAEAANLEKAVKHLAKKVNKFERVVSEKQRPIQNPIDFEGGKKEKEIELLKSQIGSFKLKERKTFANRHLFKWRIKTWIVFGVIILLWAAAFIYILLMLEVPFQPSSETVKSINTQPDTKNLLLWTISLLGFIIEFFVGKVLYSKYFDHRNIEAYIQRTIDYPEHLK